MIGSSRNYAIGMAHFQIAGGVRSMFIVCGTYLLLFFAGLGLFFYADSASLTHAGLTSLIVTLLLIFEAVVLIVVGSFRASSAIRTDMTSRMIESHRLMPIPAWRAVMGYLLGGTTHAIIFALLNVGLTYIFAGVTKTSFSVLSLYQFLLFLFAALVWTLSALGTLLFRYMYFIAVATLVVGGCLLFAAYTIFPGFALLVGPLIGDSIFHLGPPPDINVWAYPASIAGQLAFIVLLFTGACRRYRGSADTTFSGLEAIMLLFAWCAVSGIGIAMWNDFHFLAHASYGSRAETTIYWAQTVASVAAAMALAIVPVATLNIEWARKKTHPVVALLLILPCAAGIALIGVGGKMAAAYSTFKVHPAPILMTGLVAAAHLLTVLLLIKLLARFRRLAAALIIAGALLVYWLVPLILELIRAMAVPPAPGDNFFTVLTTLSPVGLLITTWAPSSEVMPSPIAGLVVQWIVVGILAAAAMDFERRRRHRPASEPTEIIPALVVIPPPPSPPPLAPVTSAPPEANSSSPSSPPA